MPAHLPHRLTTVRRLAIAAIAACALLALLCGRAEAAPWEAPEFMPTQGSSKALAVATDDAGGSMALVGSEGGGLYALTVAVKQAGSPWGYEIIAGSRTSPITGASLAVDGRGDIAVAWSESSGGPASDYADYKPASGGWEGIVPLGTAENSATPDVAIDAEGDAVAVWLTQGGPTTLIESSRHPSGGSWESGELLIPPPFTTSALQVTVAHGGSATAAWVSTAAPTESVVEAASLSAGGSWSPEGVISDGPARVSGLQLAGNAEGDAYLAWTEGSGTESKIEFAERRGSGHWASAEQVSTAQEASWIQVQNPALAADAAGGVVLAWNWADEEGEVLESAIKHFGGSWARTEQDYSPQVTSPPHIARAAGAPRVAVGPEGIAEVFWVQWSEVLGGEGEGEYLPVSARLGLDGNWDPAVALGPGAAAMSEPLLGVSPGGRAIAVWQQASTAEFGVAERDESSLLEVSTDGAGTVTSAPSGIDCGTTCDARMLEGKAVTLIATPEAGSEFTGWSGDCSGTGTCALTIGAANSVQAEFLAVPGESSGGGESEKPASTGEAHPDETRSVETHSQETAPDSSAVGGSQSQQPSSQAAGQGPSCHAPAASTSVGTFTPLATPERAALGSEVPGVRARVTVKAPSSVSVVATLSAGGHEFSLGTRSFETTSGRNLRFALPAAARKALHLGDHGEISLSIVSKATDAGCAGSASKTEERKLGVRVVKVLSTPQTGVS
jgi:Divergent InlB B-repeat domain